MFQAVAFGADAMLGLQGAAGALAYAWRPPALQRCTLRTHFQICNVR
jgi:hypothetical protein